MAQREQQHVQHSKQRGSGAGMGMLAILIALIFIVGPFVAPFEIGGIAQTILVGFGVALLTIGAVIVVITRLYQKAGANEAFVKTGMGGKKAIIDGGAVVIPVIHELVWVSLETMKLKVEGLGRNSLLTNDKLRADIRAEFYIRVNKKEEGVLQAATSLGSRCSDPESVMNLVQEKLVSALRVVAATMTLEQLNQDRSTFTTKVQEMVQKDIEHNGYILESVTISHLDQAPVDAQNPEGNVFDAEGSRRIAEIVSTARVERNLLVATADKAVMKQNVEKDKELYLLEVERANASAAKEKEIATAAATATAAAAVVRAEQEKQSQVAEVTRDQAVQVAEVAKAKALEVANQDKEKAVQVAEIDRQQTIEVAKRQQAIAVANAEKSQAMAEQEKLAAQKARETEAQAVTTVTVTATAEREAQKQVIGKRAVAEQTRIERQNDADVAAYSVKTQAEAEKEAAEARAAAVRTNAQAEKDAAELRAAGDLAVQMVPVNVSKEQVSVEQSRVAVMTAELEAKNQYSAIASELQKALAQIDADKLVGMERAKAMGQALAAAKMTVWSDPVMMAKMITSFTSGQAAGQFVAGLDNAVPTDVKNAALDGFAGLGTMASGIIKRLTGYDVSPEVAERMIKEEMGKSGVGA